MTEINKGQKDNLKEMTQLKAQKLASASYLISDFLHASDPLKWRWREQSLVIMNSINPFNLEPSLSEINLMVSYLDIVLASGQASKMNLAILKQEYQALGQLLLSGKEQTILEQLPSPTPLLKPETKLVEEFVDVRSQTSNKLEFKRQKVDQIIPKDNPRRIQILNFVKGQRESPIKDISRAVPHVSSKTVQRELAELVKVGLLVREGDRRWSRYRIAS